MVEINVGTPSQNISHEFQTAWTFWLTSLDSKLNILKEALKAEMISALRSGSKSADVTKLIKGTTYIHLDDWLRSINCELKSFSDQRDPGPAEWTLTWKG